MQSYKEGLIFTLTNDKKKAVCRFIELTTDDKKENELDYSKCSKDV